MTVIATTKTSTPKEPDIFRPTTSWNSPVQPFKVAWCPIGRAGDTSGDKGNTLILLLGGPAFASRFGKFRVGVSKNRGTPKWMIYNGKPY